MTSQETQALSDSAKTNIQDIENEIETSSAYFKAKPDKVYLKMIDLNKNKIKPVETDKFKDAKGNPLKKYEVVVTDVNTQREQIWTISKTLCLQLIGELGKGFRVLKIERIGEDRGTIYRVQGME